MPLNVENRLNVQQELSTIAEMAYGHGKGEGEAGGAGRIGLINGHVVKFNTSWQDRLFGARANDEMRKSCNDLRARFLDIARNAGLDEHAIGDIRAQLGLSREGTETATKKLLDRKVAAKVVNMISKGVSGEKSGDVWNAVTRSDVMRSSGDMDFESVQNRTAEQNNAFHRGAGASLAASILRHFPDMNGKLTADSVDELVNRHLAPLCDKARMKDGDRMALELVSATMDKLEPELRELVGAEAGADGRFAKLCGEIKTDLYARLFGAKTEAERLAYNPTGGTVRWEDGDDASGQLLSDMKKDAAAAAHAPFSQIAADYERGWSYTLGEKSFKGNSTDKSVLNEKSDFRNAFKEVFTDPETGKVDQAAEIFASRVLHQGLAVGLQPIVDSKSAFLPVMGDRSVPSDCSVTLCKSKTKGRYEVRFSQTLTGFKDMSNNRLVQAHGYGAVSLGGDTSRNRFEISYAFEFGIGDDGNPDCKMLQNVKGEMTIPTYQDIVYNDEPEGNILGPSLSIGKCTVR